MNLTAKQRVPSTPVATPFVDRVSIVQHGLDMWGHRMIPSTDLYPDYIQATSEWCNVRNRTGNATVKLCDKGEKVGCPCVPAFVPFRSHTNRKVPNLVLAG